MTSAALTGKSLLRNALVLIAVLVAAAAAYQKIVRRPPPAGFQSPAQPAKPLSPRARADVPDFSTGFVSTRQDISVHAASLVETGDGRIRAFWFAGSREGAPDVQIMTAVYDPATLSWGPELAIANREDTESSLLRYVKKLGNPVALRAPDGRLSLFYVTVSVGGWAGSSITAITSGDDGVTWSRPRRLITSPFANISTLVKGTPFLYNDGTIGLPAYHEFIGKFGVLLRIGRNGEIIDEQRLSSGISSIQPVMLVESPRQALVLMRRTGSSPKRVIAVRTEDAGRHWSEPYPTALANPDAAITGVVLPDGRILVALNDIEEGRDALSLVVSTDGGATWKTVYRLEDQRGRPAEPGRFAQVSAGLAKATDAGIGDAAEYARSAQRNKCVANQCSFEFSYPYLIRARNGDFHLVYTWNRSFIKHVRFTLAWLNRRIEKAADAAVH